MKIENILPKLLEYLQNHYLLKNYDLPLTPDTTIAGHLKLDSASQKILYNLLCTEFKISYAQTTEELCMQDRSVHNLAELIALGKEYAARRASKLLGA
jgi:hypothetical protein